MKKLYVIFLMMFTLITAYAPDVTAANYVSYFYTSGDAVIFAPETGTNISIRDLSDPSKVVWTGETPPHFSNTILTVSLPTGYYAIVSTKRIALLVGYPINGGSSDNGGYYILDAGGKPHGTTLGTYLRKEDALIVFSHQNNNNVKIWVLGEFQYELAWQGILDKGSHHIYEIPYLISGNKMLVTSDYPVSVLVVKTQFNGNPASYFIPATSGTFSGNEFYTFAPGGNLSFFSYNDGTHIELYDTLTGQKKGEWDLSKYKTSSYPIPPTDGEFYYTVQSSKPITALRRFDEQNNWGMHYIAERSGTSIGADFVFDADPPIAIFAYKDGTSVDHQRPDGSVNSYTLNASGYATITSETSGRIMSDKAVSVVSIGTVGATFVPIPDESVDTVPWPPAVFAVRHSPLKPTTNDNSVKVTWATDEMCTSCLSYRRNGGAWNQQCDSTFKTEHEMTINISGFNGNDVIEYYVNSTDQSNDTTVNDHQGSYYNFTITSYIPKLKVSRSVFEPPQYPPEDRTGVYSVHLLVENIGPATAKNIEIEEEVWGLLPTTENSTVTVTPVDNYRYKVKSPVPDIPPGGIEVVAYTLVPILYETFALYGFGPWDSIVSYRSPEGRTYTDKFLSMSILDATWVLLNIRRKDYVIATSVDRLIRRFKPEEAGRILREAAQFSLKRNGVIACLESYDRYKIERLINSNWNGRLGEIGPGIDTWNYLLFIGKVEIVPSWATEESCLWDDSRKAAVVDNLYADVKAGDDYKPELVVARLPGKDADDFIHQMDNALSPFKLDKAVLISGTGDGTGDFVEAINNVNNSLRPSIYSSRIVRHWKDFSSDTDKLNTFTNDVPDADMIIYRDHGGTTSWSSAVDTSSIGGSSGVNFTTIHPMVWSIACLTGNIRQDSLADAFLGAGASVFIGATELSPREPNNQFVNKLAQIHNDPWHTYSIGEVFKHAKRSLIDDNIHWYTLCYSNVRYKQLVNEYNLYGDPKRGLALESTASSRRGRSSEADRQYGSPPSSLEITIPEFEVKTVGDVDYVTIPTSEGGTTYAEHDEPIVPSYLHKEYIDAGFKIQDVLLKDRSGLETSSGLHLPIASFADDDSPNPGSRNNAAGVFPKQDHIFAWRVYEELDGRQMLIITIFPFYYNKDTTDVEFYRKYTFEVKYIESSVAIPNITVSQDETPPGQPVQASVSIKNGAQQQLTGSLETEILDANYKVVDVVTSVPVTIAPGETSVTVTWNSAGYDPGYYYFRETIKQNGSLLDTEAKMFRLGSYNAVSGGLEVSNKIFEIGDPVNVTARFQNTGGTDLEGLATIVIRNEATSATVKEFFQELKLSPGQIGEVQKIWDTWDIAEGKFTLLAFLQYDGKATEPLSVTISTRQDIPILIETEQDRNDPGEKVAVWISFSDPTGQPLPNVTFSAEVIDPNATIRTLELSYYPAHGFYAGTFLLPLSAPQGVYVITVDAEHSGYRPTTVTKSFCIGDGCVIPPIPPEPPVPTIPEPATVILLGVGLLGILSLRLKRRKS